MSVIFKKISNGIFTAKKVYKMNFTTIFEALFQHKNEAKAKQMSAYMLNQFEFLGLQSPVRKEIMKPFFSKVKKATTTDWNFVFQCWECPYRELQYVALEYLKLRQKYLSASDIPSLKKLIISKSWWDTIDNLDRIIGNIALKNPQVNELLIAWSTDENKWLRRVAIDHQLLRKEKTNVELLEKILVNNLEQTEFFINKAIGWALRDYSKTNPQWVRLFVKKYEGQMAKLSIKEATKYV